MNEFGQFNTGMYSLMVEVSENGATSSNRDGEVDVEDALEFTVGNPRVEHITGVIHLFRNAPGEEQVGFKLRVWRRIPSSNIFVITVVRLEFEDGC